MKQIERESNKLRHSVEDLTDENDNLVNRINEIEKGLENQRIENEQEAKEIEYDNEQRKIMDSYESLLKSKDTTIKSLEKKLEKVEERVKSRLNFNNKNLEEGIVLLKSKQTLLSQEIIKNVENSLIQCTRNPHINLPVGKMNITSILYHLNQNLFSNCFKNEEISYKELHPLSNEIFSFFIENKFPTSYNDTENTPGGHRKRNSFISAFGKLDVDEISISIQDGEELKLEDKDHLKILSILYAIIFSHFVESQMKLKSGKDTIEILEDKIQNLKDSIELEIKSKNYLKNELKQTQEQVKSTKDKIILNSVRVIQKYWRRCMVQRKSKILLQERIKKLKEIQENEIKRRSISVPKHLVIKKAESVGRENLKEENIQEPVDEGLILEEEKHEIEVCEEINPEIEEVKSPFQQLEEEQEEFKEELDEEEILYLQNTGKFFILDSMRQLDTLFGDMYHNFVEHNFKKDKGSIFDRKKGRNKSENSIEDSD